MPFSSTIFTVSSIHVRSISLGHRSLFPPPCRIPTELARPMYSIFWIQSLLPPLFPNLELRIPYPLLLPQKSVIPTRKSKIVSPTDHIILVTFSCLAQKSILLPSQNSYPCENCFSPNKTQERKDKRSQGKKRKKGINRLTAESVGFFLS